MWKNYYKTKKPRPIVETAVIYPLSLSGGFSLATSTHCSTNRFVCNFLSSSAGFNLCRCFIRFTLVFCFRFLLSLGRPFHDLSSFPFRFLTSAVLAFFRPPQFWILTTQPLFFFSFSSRCRLTVAFPVPALALAFSVSSLSPAWFPVPSFQIPVLSFAVRFLSLFPDSLPQPFLRCLPSVPLSLVRFPSGLFHFQLASFRPLAFRFQLLSLCPSFPLFPASPHSGFSGAPFRFRFFGFPRSSRPGFPCLLSRFSYSAFCLFPFALP